MDILLMRHGETLWNLENKVLGRTDIPLTVIGKEQAKSAARLLSSENIDIIFTSPLSRALDTSNIVSSMQENRCPVIAENCLIEQDFGIFEGRLRNDYEYQENKRFFFKKYPQGESYLDVAARVYPFIYRLKTSSYSKALIITHGGICRIISNFFNDMDNEQFASFSIPNCDVKRFTL